MSGSSTNSTILVSDSAEQIKEKVMKHAFSGGRDTAEDHRKYGANISVDVPYEYLRYILEDDEKLEEIRELYSLVLSK
jgi:tryptophanyl-tRNA synthetase